MRSSLLLIFACVACVARAQPVTPAPSTAPASAPASAPVRDFVTVDVPSVPVVGVLILPGDGPPEVLDAAVQNLRKLPTDKYLFTIRFLNADAMWPPANLKPDSFSEFGGLLVFVNGRPQPDVSLPAEVRTRLLSAVRDGLGIVALRGAIEAFPDWEAYGVLLGARAVSMPWGFDAPPLVIRSEDRFHPSSNRLTPNWLIPASMYEFGPPYARAKLHIILSLDKNENDLTAVPAKRPDQDYPVAWARYEGKGAVFYSALGDSVATWQDEYFQHHVRGAIRWVIGQYAGLPHNPTRPVREFLETPQKVRYSDITMGDGDPPRIYDTVKIHLIARLPDQTLLRDTYSDGQPLSLIMGARTVMWGLEDGIATMRVGGRRLLEVPPEMQTGAGGMEDKIPPNTPVYFDVEMIEIKRQ